MDVFFEKIAIIGVGLIGGSFARACRDKGIAGEITGSNRHRENLEKAKSLGIIDSFSDEPSRAVDGADLVFISTPVGTIPEVARKVAPTLKKGSIITDAGSVKGSLVEEVEDIVSGSASFVGGHPIAGTEKSGVDASVPDLFEGAKVILTITDNTDKSALDTVKNIWGIIGSIVTIMDPFTHDRVFAAVSHLPHVVAYALVNAIGDMDGSNEMFSYTGGGFRDFTRIASSDPGMWSDICSANRDNLIHCLESFRESLSRIENLIENDESGRLLKEFERAVDLRKNIL